MHLDCKYSATNPQTSQQTGYTLEYGDKSQIAPDRLVTKTIQVCDQTGEVLESHTLYCKKDDDGHPENPYQGSVSKWFHYSLRFTYGLDYDYSTNLINELFSTNDNRTVRILVNLTDWTPEIAADGRYYYVHMHSVSEANNLDPALFIARLGLMPQGTKISWLTAPKWAMDDPDDPDSLEVSNIDDVAIQVEVPGQAPVTFKAADYENRLANHLSNFTFGYPNEEMKNVFDTNLGQLPDLNKFIHNGSDDEEKPAPIWIVKPNIGLAGYSFGWLSFDNNPESSSLKTMVLVRTDPQPVSQSIICQDKDGQRLNSTELTGQITNLYEKAGSFNANDLTDAIKRLIPAGYHLVRVDGFNGQDIQYGPNLSPIVVVVEKNYGEPGDDLDYDLPELEIPDSKPEEKPTQPQKPAEVDKTENTGKVNLLPNKATGSQTLPQTGDQPAQTIGLAGLALATMSVLLGFGYQRKRK